MTQKEFEMPDDYKANLAHLTQFLDDRERLSQQIKDLPPHLLSEATVQLRKFDEIIDGLEKELAAEYERHQAAMAREVVITEKSDEMMERMKEAYIIIKHQTPHLLESFTTCLDPLTPEDREQFLDDVAILEATKLDAILNGEA